MHKHTREARAPCINSGNTQKLWQAWGQLIPSGPPHRARHPPASGSFVQVTATSTCGFKIGEPEHQPLEPWCCQRHRRCSHSTRWTPSGPGKDKSHHCAPSGWDCTSPSPLPARLSAPNPVGQSTGATQIFPKKAAFLQPDHFLLY